MSMKLNQITDQADQTNEPVPVKESDANKTLLRIFIPNFLQTNNFSYVKRHQYRAIFQMLYVLYALTAVNTIALLILWIKVYFWSK